MCKLIFLGKELILNQDKNAELQKLRKDRRTDRETRTSKLSSEASLL